MAIAGNLTSAATLSYDQGALAWYATTIKTKFQSFITTVSPLLSDARPNERTVGNWLVGMWALSEEINGTPFDVSEAQFNAICTYLYRFCYAAALAQAEARITNAQAIAILAAWNLYFGT